MDHYQIRAYIMKLSVNQFSLSQNKQEVSSKKMRPPYNVHVVFVFIHTSRKRKKKKKKKNQQSILKYKKKKTT